jgi:hypothetical protein
MASRSSGGRVGLEVRFGADDKNVVWGIVFRHDDVVQSSFVYYLRCISQDNGKHHETNSHARPALSAKRVAQSRAILHELSSAAELLYGCVAALNGICLEVQKPLDMYGPRGRKQVTKFLGTW